MKNISIWELETIYRKREIVIVGAGFTGLWTAISIKEKYPQKSVLILEKMHFRWELQLEMQVLLVSEV